MISYGSVIDPYDPDLPNSRQSPTFFTVGNTDLEPEKTRSYNLGVVFTPTRDTALSIDWYQIKLDNLIGTGNTTAIVQGNNPADVIRDPRGKLQAVKAEKYGRGVEELIRHGSLRRLLGA